MKMTPTKQQWKEILKTAKKLQKQDLVINKKWNDLLSMYSQNNVPAAIDSENVHIFCLAMNLLYKDGHVTDAIEYYLYEVPPVVKREGKCECSFKGVKYDANNLGSYVNFLYEQHR